MRPVAASGANAFARFACGLHTLSENIGHCPSDRHVGDSQHLDNGDASHWLGVGMTSEGGRDTERRRLWSEYEAGLWADLAAVKRQEDVTGTELDELSAAQRKALRTLSRLRELVDR
jgi:hypothetical protein